MGTFRLILALMVVHTHLSQKVLNEYLAGVSAVTVFFILSGYAMTGLIQQRFLTPNGFLLFYYERAVRLAPLYYFWLIISFFFALYVRLPFFSTPDEGINYYGLFSYLTIIPLGLQQYFGSSTAHVMGQAASLGIEIIMLILAPFILTNKFFSRVAAIICLCVFIATSIEILPKNIYIYYNFPGPMMFFLLGNFLFKKDWNSLVFFTTTLTIILIAPSLIYQPKQGYNLELLVGILVGLPTIFLLSKLKFSKYDYILGNMSYGCFLGHGIIIGCLKYYTNFSINLASVIITMFLSAFAGYLSFYLIERKTIKFRRNIHKKYENKNMNNASLEPKTFLKYILMFHNKTAEIFKKIVYFLTS